MHADRLVKINVIVTFDIFELSALNYLPIQKVCAWPRCNSPDGDGASRPLYGTAVQAAPAPFARAVSNCFIC